MFARYSFRKRLAAPRRELLFARAREREKEGERSREIEKMKTMKNRIVWRGWE